MPRYITAGQYKRLLEIPRSRLAVRIMVFCGVVVVDKGKILLVKVSKEVGSGWDLPGGKLLWNEDVFECAEREVLEESGYKIKLDQLLGVYQRSLAENSGQDYLRIVFIGSLKNRRQRKITDPFITSAKWFDIKDLQKNKVKFRSSEVLREINDYSNGKSFPLEAVESYVW